MNLRELQLSVAEALLDSRQKLGLDHALCAFVESTDRPAPHERLRLCRRAVIATLTDALERVYPACRALVEAEYFSSAARRYAFGTPAVSAERNDYGDRFADHLEMLPSIESMPYLPDLARLEWLWHRAANAAEDDPLTLDELLHIDFERFYASQVGRAIVDHGPDADERREMVEQFGFDYLTDLKAITTYGQVAEDGADHAESIEGVGVLR